MTRKNLTCVESKPLFSYLRYGSVILLLIVLTVSEIDAQSYFQQKLKYQISANLNDVRHLLNCSEKIVYINNSPDTLGYIIFNLWPNACSDNKTALAKEIIRRDGRSKLFNDPLQKGSVDSLDFRVNGFKVLTHYSDNNPEFCRIDLSQRLNPGDSVIITTPFRVVLPENNVTRMGHLRDAYLISAWYPQPAVYNNEGWHPGQYLDQGGRFSEIGDYEVSITLPANYITIGSGSLTDNNERLFLDSLASGKQAFDLPGWLGDVFPASSSKQKTIHFSGKNLNEFTWVADKRFVVMKGTVTIPKTEKKVSLYSFYTSKQSFPWRGAILMMQNVIKTLAGWNGDFPQDSFYAVQSDVYKGTPFSAPGLVIINRSDDTYNLENDIAEGINEQWFSGVIGADCRTYPYMSYSIAAASTERYMHFRYPGKKLWEIRIKNEKIASFLHADKIPAGRVREIEWLVPERLNLHQPVSNPSGSFNSFDFKNIIIDKGGFDFNFLREYLGNQIYDSAIQLYLQRWTARHPSPGDLRDAFTEVSGKDLNWFFSDMIASGSRLDYKILRGDSTSLVIKNMGKIEAPLLLSHVVNDSITDLTWVDGFRGTKKIAFNQNNSLTAEIDPLHFMPEIYRLNNNYNYNGIIRWRDPVHLQLLYAFEDPGKRYFAYFPVLNWNKTDGIMAGVAFNNGLYIPKRIEYFVLPFIALDDQSLTGFARMTINAVPPGDLIRLMSFTAEAERYGAPGPQKYKIASAGTDIHLRMNDRVNQVDKKISVFYTIASDLLHIESITPAKMRSFIRAGYTETRNSIVDPYNAGLWLEAGERHRKISFELNYKYSYYGRRNGLDMRIFTGYMIQNDPATPYYSLSPDARNGTELYFYDGEYIDRFRKSPSNVFSRQVSLIEGGFVSNVSDSLQYSKWLCTFSASSSLPGIFSRLPIRPFVNLLLNDHGYNSAGPALFFETGLKAGIMDVIEIWFPFFVTDKTEQLAGPFRQRIRFTFSLDKLSLFKTRL